jgi:CheY-like chemotaxis protein
MTRRARVLLIDDSKFLRLALERILAEQGFEVHLAADGEEGLHIAQTSEPDLIVLDLFLPKMTGHEVIKHLKESATTSSIPILVLSGIAHEADLQALKQMGIEDCLSKTSLALDEIARHVEQCLKLRAGV